jgi:tetratricopeptide (TPR) repeat protein
MKPADCYRLLGLRDEATLEEVKASYRRLARQYHPDTAGADQQANEKFIRLTNAYKVLVDYAPSIPAFVPPVTPPPTSAPVAAATATATAATASGIDQSVPATSDASVPAPQPSRRPLRTVVYVEESAGSPNASPAQTSPQPLTPMDRALKAQTYQQLQDLLKTKRFPRAIALVEGLAQRLPSDGEVRQWQAIAYQSWGRHLIQDNQLDKARVYFKKALKTVPNNQPLCSELERDLSRVERLMQRVPG